MDSLIVGFFKQVSEALGLTIAGQALVAGLAILTVLAYRFGFFRGKRNDETWRKLRIAANEAAELRDRTEQLTKTLDEKKAALAAANRENRKYRALRKSLLGGDEGLWTLHGSEPYAGYDKDVLSSELEIITVMNLKGGVGKTTIATNLAAYFSDPNLLNKRVLIVDMDYQGSATNAILPITQHGTLDGVSVLNIFQKTPSTVSVNDAVLKLVGSPMPDCGIVPCEFGFAAVEDGLMVKWLMQEIDFDPRYMLSQFLHRAAITSKYDIVIIDAPPRLSMGAINALCASQSVIVPAMADKLSIDAVRNFVERVNGIKAQVNQSLVKAFFVLNGTKQAHRSAVESELWSIITGDDYGRAWDGKYFMVDRCIPRRAVFASSLNNATLAYFQNDATASVPIKDIIRQFGDEVARGLNIPGILSESYREGER